MTEYRFYEIGKDGHISHPPTVVDCPDDLTAVKRARDLLSDADIEIWDGCRVIAHLVPESFG